MHSCVSRGSSMSEAHNTVQPTAGPGLVCMGLRHSCSSLCCLVGNWATAIEAGSRFGYRLVGTITFELRICGYVGGCGYTCGHVGMWVSRVRSLLK